MSRPCILCLFIACAGAATGVVGCAQAGAVSSPSSAELLLSIRAEIGQAGCETDSQCHVIGVGAKACGGPEGYLAWSSRQTDQAKLLSLVERHRAVRRVEVERSGILSDCRVAPEPGVACVPAADGGDAAGRRVCRLQTLRGSAGITGGS